MFIYKTYRKSQAATLATHKFVVDDFANMDFCTLILMLGTFMPIVRLDHKPDYYLIGTECKYVTVRDNDCKVGVGGGFVSILEYYDSYSFK